jgi:hypothetical protein
MTPVSWAGRWEDSIAAYSEAIALGGDDATATSQRFSNRAQAWMQLREYEVGCIGIDGLDRRTSLGHKGSS